MGVKQMVVAVNKMDEESVGWGEKRYWEVRNEVSTYLKRVGFNP